MRFVEKNPKIQIITLNLCFLTFSKYYCIKIFRFLYSYTFKPEDGLLKGFGFPCEILSTRLNTGDVFLFSTYRFSFPLSFFPPSPSPFVLFSLFVSHPSFIVQQKPTNRNDIHNNRLLSAGTRFFTRSKWDHVAVVVVMNNMPMLLEVTHPIGVELTPATNRLRLYR